MSSACRSASFGRSGGSPSTRGSRAGTAAGEAGPAALIGAGWVLFGLGAELRARSSPARLGAANAVTVGRLGLVIALACCLRVQPGPPEAALISIVFALDGLDGWLAR